MKKTIAILVLLNFSFYAYASDVKNEDSSLKNYDSYESSDEEKQAAAMSGKRRGSDSYLEGNEILGLSHSQKSPFSSPERPKRYKTEAESDLKIFPPILSHSQKSPFSSPERPKRCKIESGNTQSSPICPPVKILLNRGIFNEKFLNQMSKISTREESPTSHLYNSLHPSPTEEVDVDRPGSLPKEGLYVFNSRTVQIAQDYLPEEGLYVSDLYTTLPDNPPNQNKENNFSPASPSSTSTSVSDKVGSKLLFRFGAKLSSPAFSFSSSISPKSLNDEKRITPSSKSSSVLGVIVNRLLSISPYKPRSKSADPSHYLIGDEDFSVQEETRKNVDFSPFVVDSEDEEVLKQFEGSTYSK